MKGIYLTQEIKPTYATFEQAKWLKEKGFDIQCLRFYTKPNSKMFGIDEHYRNYPIKNISKKLYTIGEHAVLNIENVFFAPEQHVVVEWLRVNHGIWVSCYPTSNPLKCQFRIYKNNNGVMSQVYDDYMGKEFNSPQEAYLVAIDYILNNLI